jgi:type VI protein secretion system component VasK
MHRSARTNLNMIEQNIIKGKAARSLIFMTIIGGLLFLSSVAMWMMWGFVCDKHEMLPQISLLEAIGLVSIVYVLYFAHQISQQAFADKKTETSANHQEEEPKCSPEVSNCLKKMSTEEKEILKKEIATCCGLKKQNSEPNENVLNVSKFFKSSLSK